MHDTKEVFNKWLLNEYKKEWAAWPWFITLTSVRSPSDYLNTDNVFSVLTQTVLHTHTQAGYQSSHPRTYNSVPRSIFFSFLFFNYCLFYYSCPNFPPLPSSALPSPCSHSPSPHCCPCPWVILVLWLVPSPSFHCLHFLFSYKIVKILNCFCDAGKIILYTKSTKFLKG